MPALPGTQAWKCTSTVARLSGWRVPDGLWAPGYLAQALGWDCRVWMQ